LLEHALKRREILGVVEDGHPGVGPIQHVVNTAAFGGPVRSGHAERLSDGEANVNIGS
jgi:hypothetical protein